MRHKASNLIYQEGMRVLVFVFELLQLLVRELELDSRAVLLYGKGEPGMDRASPSMPKMEIPLNWKEYKEPILSAELPVGAKTQEVRSERSSWSSR